MSKKRTPKNKVKALERLGDTSLDFITIRPPKKKRRQK